MRRGIWAAFAILLTLAGVLLPREAFAAREGTPQLDYYQAAAVCDSDGNILWGVNEDVEMPMASITKVMTAVVFLERGPSLEGTTVIGEHEIPDYSNLAGYVPGEVVSLQDLWNVMFVYSANDAAVMLGRACAGSDEAFAEMMNEKAAELGMNHSHFMNAHGLEEEGHYSCASDLLILGRYALENHPLIAKSVLLHEVTIPVNGEDVTFYTTDDLVGTYSGIRGIKTGQTENGCTFLGCAERGGIRFYSCVLGCDTSDIRFENSRRMLDWGFSAFSQKTLASPGNAHSTSQYAYRFGWEVASDYSGSAQGMVDKDGGDVTFTRLDFRPDVLVESNAAYGAVLWEQDGRTVSAASITTSAPQRAHVDGFGPFMTRIVEASTGATELATAA